MASNEPIGKNKEPLSRSFLIVFLGGLLMFLVYYIFVKSSSPSISSEDHALVHQQKRAMRMLLGKAGADTKGSTPEEEGKKDLKVPEKQSNQEITTPVVLLRGSHVHEKQSKPITTTGVGGKEGIGDEDGSILAADEISAFGDEHDEHRFRRWI